MFIQIKLSQLIIIVMVIVSLGYGWHHSSSHHQGHIDSDNHYSGHHEGHHHDDFEDVEDFD